MQILFFIVYYNIQPGLNYEILISLSKAKVYAIPTGIKLPDNVMAVTSVLDSVADADILVWVLPHQVSFNETYNLI